MTALRMRVFIRRRRFPAIIFPPLMDLRGYLWGMLIAATFVSHQTHARGNRRRRLTAEEQLIMDLFKGYDTDARAVINTNNTVKVEIEFVLLRIQKLDERSQVLMTTGLVIAEWSDERLIWDPKDYNDIKDVVVRAGRIWIPELAIINGADAMIQEFEKIRVLISHDGKVHWEPGGVFMTTCDIDITYFPFDTQACPIEIGAWAYKTSRMNLTSVREVIETHEFKVNGEWAIRNTAAIWEEITLPCCPDIRYSKVVFVMILDRRYMFYIMNIILPCTLLSVLILVVFCVPPDAGEKISAGISVLLAFTVFLLMLADNVPRTSLNVPIIVIYLGSTMALGTASVCLTVVVLNMHHRGSHAPVPGWARVVFLYYFARAFGLPHVPRTLTACRGRVRSKPNNFQNCGDDANDATEMLEVRHILSTADKISPRNVPENYIRNETMRYHNVDPHNSSRVSQDEVVMHSHEDVIREWRIFARVMDRIFFCTIFFIMTACALFILTSPWWKQTTPNAI